jgi:hypothetical protein
MRTETRTMVTPGDGLKSPVIEHGPRWVFELWDSGVQRCAARTAQGGQCRRYVNLQAGISRHCERHRAANEPVYYLRSTSREQACPCGCGYGVLTTVLDAVLIAGQTRRERTLWPVAHEEPDSCQPPAISHQQSAVG